MYAYSVKGRAYILREQEIRNPSYDAEICLQITQFENQPWKRRTAGFSQLRPVLLFENLLETTNVFIVFANLLPLQVAKDITTFLLKKKKNKNRTMQASLLRAQIYTCY